MKIVATTVVGYIALGMAHIFTVYNVFALALKARFELTQTQCKLFKLFAEFNKTI